MSWNLTLPPKPAADIAAERDLGAHTAGYSASIAAGRAKQTDFEAPKTYPGTETVSWDAIVDELNAQAGLSAPVKG